jgi:hypothetical protein
MGAFTRLGEEVLGQYDHVSTAFSEGRQHDAHDVQTKEQVLAEPAGEDGSLQVLVGRRDDADVDLDARSPPDPGDLAILEDVKKLGLQGRVQVADLAQEDGALVGGPSLPIWTRQ